MILLLAPAFTRAQATDQAPAQVPPAESTTPPKPESVIKLDPFEVTTTKDTSYGALNSNSITQFNTELSKTPVVADIFTRQFMEDTQVQSVEELFNRYATSGGMVLATPDSDSNATQPGDRFSVAQFGVRGLSAGTAHRDGFDFSPTNINATSIFDIERVEVLHGSQGLLYGATGAGGVVNIVSKPANFNRSAGEFSERMDQYGSKLTNLDYNWGNSWVAFRGDLLNQNNHFRRLFIGDTTEGYYGQLAFKLPFGITDSTLRFIDEETHNDRIFPNNTTVNFGNATADPRNGDNLFYLYATHQLGANNPATGTPFTSGRAIDNGVINTQNIQSFGGWQSEEDQDNTVNEISLDTTWTKWLSTSFAGLYDKSQQMRSTNLSNLYAPGVAANLLPTDWAINSSLANSENPELKKSYRANALFSFDFLDGKISTKTGIGFEREYDYDKGAGIQYSYYLANPAGGVTIDTTSKSNLGRTQIPSLWWAVDQGPLEYPYSKVGAKSLYYDGRFGGTPGVYVRMPTNPRSVAWVTPNNPQGLASLYEASLNNGNTEGVSGNNPGSFSNQNRAQGYYIANYTSWWDDRFDTLFGLRESDIFIRAPNTVTTTQQAWIETRSGTLPSYNAGVNVRLSSWMNLRGYYGYSRTFNVPVNFGNDALGAAPPNPTGWTHEGGIKFQTDKGGLSGDIALWTGAEYGDTYNAGSNYENTVNPGGLNGSANGPNGGRSTWSNSDHTSRGIELAVTAELNNNWRVRFSASVQDGTILKTKSYPMLYNDQFYTDSHGNVTYANGQPFLVPTDATNYAKLQKQNAAVDPAASYTGATFTQLTTTMMNTPGNPYYVWSDPNNQPFNGSLGNPVGGGGVNSAVVNSLKYFHNGGTTGPTALTGVTGLPISAIQYNWSDPGNYKGTYIQQKKGDYTVGYPVFSTNTVTDYTFTTGPIKGLGIGGALFLAWYNRTYYFATPDQVRHLYSAPLINPQVNAFFSYTHKLGKWVTWRTQVNINNLFNRYEIGLTPNNGAGYGNPNNVGATYYGEPRTYVWSNTFNF